MTKVQKINEHAVLELYQNEPDATDEEVAQLFGVGEHVIREIRYKNNLMRVRGRKASIEPTERDKEILKMIRAGVVYEDIAARFKLTRQRIEQISRRWKVERRTGSRSIRHTTFEQRQRMFAKYTELAVKPRQCWLCGGDIKRQEGEKSQGRYCEECGQVLEIIRIVRSRLRIAANERLDLQRRRHGLTQAAYMIRAWGLQPEDLRF